MDELNEYLAAASEIQRNRLYFVTFKNNYRPHNTSNTLYFTIDEEFHYENFFHDFGPLDICMLYYYCNRLNEFLADRSHAKKKIVHYTSTNEEKRLNAAYLIGSFAIIYLNRTPDEVYRLLTVGKIPPYIRFCDASSISSTYKISLLDCLNAVYKGMKAGFFNFDDFDNKKYCYYEMVENGDLNWILPEKFLAFCGPHNEKKVKNGYIYHEPEKYLDYFRLHNVTTVIRLNVKMYDAQRFVQHGFDHKELYFVDGTTPTDHILKQFLNICETTNGAVAVHCKAGLGRTGTLIGAYIMKHYKFNALEAIAWLRLCRPGSVIAHQQQWLEDKQMWLWDEGEQYRKKRNINSTPVHTYGIYSIKKMKLNANNAVNRNSLHILKKNSVLKDRVQKTSRRLDNMKLTDDDAPKNSSKKQNKVVTTPTVKNNCNDPITDNSEVLTALLLHHEQTNVSALDKNHLSSSGSGFSLKSCCRDENKNSPIVDAKEDISSEVAKDLKSIKLIGRDEENNRIRRVNVVSEENGEPIGTQGDQLNKIKAMRRRHSRSVNLSTSLNDPFYRHTRAKSQPFRNKTKLIPAVPQSPTKPMVAFFDPTDNDEKTTTATARVNRITAYNKRMAMQIRKVKEVPASSQQFSGSNANIINNNNTASKHPTKEDTKSSFLLRRSSRIDYHHGGEKKTNSNVTTPTSTTTTTSAASALTRNRMYLERPALKSKGNAICQMSDGSSPTQNHKVKENLDQKVGSDDSHHYVWHAALASDGDCCDDSVNLDLDIATSKSRIEKSNSVKRGKRSLSSTRVAKSNEKNIKRKTASDANQPLTFGGKVDDLSRKETYDGADISLSVHSYKREWLILVYMGEFNAKDLKSIKLIGRDEENNRIRRVNVVSEENGEPIGTQGDQLNKIKAMRRRHSRSVNLSTSLNDPFYRHTRAKSQPFRNKTKLIPAVPQSPTKPMVAFFDPTDNDEKTTTATARVNRITAYNKRMAMQIRKVKEVPASSQQFSGSNANIINNNNTASKHPTKEDTKSSFLLRRSSRIDYHHGGEKKTNSNVTTPTSTTTTTSAASALTRNRMYLERPALKSKGNAICQMSDGSSPTQNHKVKENLDQKVGSDDSHHYVWHAALASDGDCCDDSVNLDLDIATSKSRIEKSNSVKRGKRSLSSTRVAKSNEKNIKRKTASDANQPLTFGGKVDDLSRKETYDGGKSDHHMSLRLRKR